MLEFKMSGDLQLDRVLYNMERKAARNTITRAVRRTLRPVTNIIRGRIKSELFTMDALSRAKYSSQIDLSTRVIKGGVVGRIRTKAKRIRTNNKRTNFAPLAHLFESGVAPHLIYQPKRKRTLKHPGIKENPIWQDTFDKNRETMVRDYREYLLYQIIREFDKGK